MNFVKFLLTLTIATANVSGYNVLFWATFGSKSHKFVLNAVAEELGRRGHQLFLTLTLATANVINGYNILFWATMASKSHKFVLNAVAEELGRRGHNVVFITSFDENKPSNIKNVLVPETFKILDNDEFNMFKGNIASSDLQKIMLKISLQMINATYSHPFIKDIIDNPRDLKQNVPKFDLLVIDGIMNDFAIPLAHHMQIPTVFISPSIVFIQHAWHLNIPYPLSYVPVGIISVPENMLFQHRAQNALIASFFFYMNTFTLYPQSDNEIKKFLPNSPPIEQLLKNISFIISNDHPAIGPSVPTMPYYVQLGGLHLKPAKKLPEDLESFMQSSGKHGVIYFSLGSYTKGSTMPADMRKKLLEAFSKVPQKVLWKNEQPIDGLSPNVRVIKWAPQGDLLAHPKLKLFITHGGMLSMQESVYHECPILGFPLSADQLNNIGRTTYLGFGEMLDWQTFSADDLLEKIRTMLENPRYRENVKKLSVIFKDRPQQPVDTAAYWIEYVIRHKGAPHLKSGAEHLNVFQYFLLDVIGAIAAIVGILLFLIVVILKFLYRVISKKLKKGSKLKSNKEKKQ